MQKQAPTLPRLLTMVLFALSCFGLLLYLWVAFGGSVPLKPKGYRFAVDFNEAAQLGTQADVRVAGVKVGRVQGKQRSPDGDATRAIIELDRKFAPIASDARATLRFKTVVGETYVELTTGSDDAPPLAEGDVLPNKQVKDTVELDEILDTFDPYTRAAYRTWQQSLGQAVRHRGQDLNDAFGSLPGFVEEGGDLFEVLDDQQAQLKGLVKNTGVVFGALTEREAQLRRLVENSDTVFTAIQRERESFAQTWNTFPTFLDESKATFRRLQRFARNTRPLVRDLKPAMEDLAPTLRDVGDLAPDLRRLFINLDPLIERSKVSLPATRQVLDGLRPLLGAVGPWLSELNPTLDWIAMNQHTLTDVFANLGAATSAKTVSSDPRAPGHYLRQYGVAGAEVAAVHPTRLSSNRGNAYINPLALTGPDAAKRGIIAAFDCENAGGDKVDKGEPGGSPTCETQKPLSFQGRLTRFPNVNREDYGR